MSTPADVPHSPSRVGSTWNEPALARTQVTARRASGAVSADVGRVAVANGYSMVNTAMPAVAILAATDEPLHLSPPTWPPPCTSTTAGVAAVAPAGR